MAVATPSCCMPLSVASPRHLNTVVVFSMCVTQGVKSHIRLDDQQFAFKAVRRFFEAADAAGLMLFSKVGRCHHAVAVTSTAVRSRKRAVCIRR